MRIISEEEARKAAEKKETARTLIRAARCQFKKLDALRSGGCRRRAGGLGERAGGLLLGALIDFDGTLKVRTVFNHDPRGGQVAIHRTIFLDLDPVFGATLPLHRAVHHYFARHNTPANLP